MPRHKTSGSFKKGYIPWIKGKHHSEETKQKLKLVNKGRHLSPETEFKKGMKIFWNPKKNKNTKIKISKTLKKKYKEGIIKSYGGVKFKGFRITHQRYSIFKRKLMEEIDYCEKCGINDKRVLILHHNDKNKKNNQRNNLRILCANCHMIEHSKESE